MEITWNTPKLLPEGHSRTQKKKIAAVFIFQQGRRKMASVWESLMKTSAAKKGKSLHFLNCDDDPQEPLIDASRLKEKSGTLWKRPCPFWNHWLFSSV